MKKEFNIKQTSSHLIEKCDNCSCSKKSDCCKKYKKKGVHCKKCPKL